MRRDDYRAALLAKLQWVIAAAREIKASPVIIGGGDIFDTPTVSLEVADDIVDLFTREGAKLATVFGNHDLDASLATAPRTVLGHLMRRSNGVFMPLPMLHERRGYQLAGMEIFGHHYRYGNHHDSLMLPVTGDLPRVIISHSMILKSAPVFDDYTLFSDVETNADLILLGHYHPQQLPERLINTRGTLIGGPGALMRGALSRDDLTRAPAMAVVENAWPEIHVDFVPIAAAAPAAEIFRLEEAAAEAAKEAGLDAFRADLDNLKVQGLNVASLIEEISKADQLPDDVRTEALRRIGVLET
jgi:hypothetical protein